MPRPGSTRLIRLFANLFMARFSPADIDRVARTPLRIGIAGDTSLLQQFRKMVVLDRVPPDVPFPSLSAHAMPPDDPANHWYILDDCQMVVVLLRREDLMGDAIYRVKEALPKKVPAVWVSVGQVEPWLKYEIGEIAQDLKISTFVWVDELDAESARPMLKEILKSLGGYDLSVARKMPVFRDLVASRVIARTSKQNLMIAMASALPSSLPWIGPIVGILGVTAEIIFLTSNQLRMVLQLASLYDQEMDVAERLKELLPVIGGAFGWRALSRELVGFVPAIGPGVKGAIAYAATRATGEGARWFYKTGTHMDPEERRRIYNEAFEKAGALTEKVGAMLPSLGKKETRELVESPEPPAWTEAVLGPDDPEAPRAEASGGMVEAPAAEPPAAEALAAEPPAAEAPAEPAAEAPAAEAPVEPPVAEPPAPEASAADSSDAPAPADATQEAETRDAEPPPSAPPRPRTRPKIDIERNAGRRGSRKPDASPGRTDADAPPRKKDT